MANISMRSFKIEKINYCNQFGGQKTINIRTGMNFKLNYAPQNKTCLGRMIIQLKPTDISMPYVYEIEMVGIFNYDPDEDKREVHVEVAKTMHQYMVDVSEAMMKSAGGPVLKMPEFKMTVDDVQVNEPQ